MSSDQNLTRIREIITTDDPDVRLPKVVESMDLLVKRVDYLEQRVRTLELEKDRLTGDLRKFNLLLDEHPSLLSRLGSRFKRN